MRQGRRGGRIRRSARRSTTSIQEILLEDLPFAPIFAYELIVGVKDRVHGYEVEPLHPVNSWNTGEWSAT